MKELNLNATGVEQELVLSYLQQNASDVLAEKINNGTPIEKDGKQLINKKTLGGFMTFACEEAKKLAEKGARGACIEDKTVFGWAIHYFEEDSIEGKLYNADGTAYKQPKPKYEPKPPTTPIAPPAPKPKPQMSLFDLMEITEDVSNLIDDQMQPTIQEPNPTESIENTQIEEDDDDIPSEEEQQEILRELAEEEQQQVFSQPIPEKHKGSPLYQRYAQLQRQYPDAVVAMRLGDFYEVFGKNAVTIANELDLTLTGRDCGLAERVPMVGFPYHAAEIYFSRICEQHKLAVAESTDELKLMQPIEQDELIDSEVGEVLTEEEMRKFDGDMEEPKDIPDTVFKAESTAVDDNIIYKLSELLGNILIAR